MASTDIVTTRISPPSSRDGSTGLGSGRSFFSKIARSPTTTSERNRHKASPSAAADSVSDQLPELPAASQLTKRNQQSRPNILRNTSAPVVPTSTRSTGSDPILARTYSEHSGQQNSDAQMSSSATVSLNLRSPAPDLGRLYAGEMGAAGLLPPAQMVQVIPNYQYQHIRETSQKRIATLNYIRKAHEGRSFWFNTAQFTKIDISRLPSYTPSRLARRAQNYLLLGFSVPAVLDAYPPPHPNNTSSTNASLACEVLRSLNILLTEFESYQQLHPADGSHANSLTRARIPQMFKRAATVTAGRPRKSSGAPDSSSASQISPPAIPDHHSHQPHFSIDSSNPSTRSYSSNSTVTLANSNFEAGNSSGNMSSTNFSTTSSFPPPAPPDAPNSTCLPNEGPYTHLLTPPLAFSPDFASVLATLCDVLIDVYQRLLQMINSPSVCVTTVADGFLKADAKIRKVLVGGIVKEFETAARESSKKELMGVQKVVLGGLMGM